MEDFDEVTELVAEQRQEQPQPGEQSRKNPTYTPEQKAHIDGFVKSAMGRAGREARANEAAALERVKALELQLAATREIHPESVDDKVHSMSLRLAEKDAELRATKAQQTEAEILEQLRTAAHEEKIDFVDPVAYRLLRERTKVEDGKIVVTDLDDSMEPLTLKEHVRRFADEKPFLVRGSVAGGTGSTQATPHPVSNEVRLRAFFMDASACNRMALQNKAGYQRLKAQALSQYGIIPGVKSRGGK